MRDLVAAIKTGKPPGITPEHALASLKVALQASQVSHE